MVGGTDTKRDPIRRHGTTLRPKPCKLAYQRPCAERVAGKLRCTWLPEQIAGWLKLDSPDIDQRCASRKTICTNAANFGTA